MRADNAKNEYYLTDAIALARAEGHRIAALEAPAPEVAGVNSRADLAQAEAVVQQRLRTAAMDAMSAVVCILVWVAAAIV